eukprot:4902767-Amphidinium_carterae.1
MLHFVAKVHTTHSKDIKCDIMELLALLVSLVSYLHLEKKHKLVCDILQGAFELKKVQMRVKPASTTTLDEMLQAEGTKENLQAIRRLQLKHDALMLEWEK